MERRRGGEAPERKEGGAPARGLFLVWWDGEGLINPKEANGDG
jgi:hypothetical protein